MKKLIVVFAIVFLLLIGGCLDGDKTPGPGVEVDNQADHPVDVDVVIASPDSSIVVEYRNGTEIAYAPDEIEGQGLGDLDGASVVDGEQYGTISAEQGQQSSLDIDEYDSESYVVAIVHRQGDPSTNFAVQQCGEGIPRIGLTPRENVMSSTRSCRS